MSGQEKNRLAEIWEPRIGADGVKVLRRSSYVGALSALGVFASAVGASFTFPSHGIAGVLLGMLSVAVGLGLFAVLVQTRRDLAAAISRHFGTEVRWWEMPRMRTTFFDAWAKRRNLSRDA